MFVRYQHRGTLEDSSSLSHITTLWSSDDFAFGDTHG